MIKIYRLRHFSEEDTIEYEAQTEAEALKFIGAAAKELNFGIMRHWVSENPTQYLYDCGPVTYYTEVPIDENDKKIF